MTGLQSDRSIRIEGNATGSTLISGDGNTVYVIQQTVERQLKAVIQSTNKTIGPNPYKGLAAFKESDAALYFGRETQVERLWQRFQNLYEATTQPRILPILGPSGCGKSSLARAGLLPELARRPLPTKDSIRIATLLPGPYPLDALAGVLRGVNPHDKFANEFEAVLAVPNEQGEYDGLLRIASRIPDIRNTPLVILIDQFEEVFSLCKSLPQRQAFIDNLLCAASDPAKSVSVVITLRSDFLGETQHHEQLNQIVGSDQSMIVPAMTAAELRRAIAEPARHAGHPLDEATIDLLIRDTETREGALPLLQFALTRIWEGLRDGQEPAVTYRDMGGVGGALASKAQEIYDHNLQSSEREIARRIFVGLVQLGEGARDTRRRVAVKSLKAAQDSPQSFERVLHQFASPGARLISLANQEGRETAEVTHEALFEHWTLLRNWIDENRHAIRDQRHIEADAEEWLSHGKHRDFLLRGSQLSLAEDFLKRHFKEFGLSSHADEFVKTSIRRRQLWSIAKTVTVSGGFVFLVSSIFSIIVGNQSNQSRIIAENSSVLVNFRELDALNEALEAGRIQKQIDFVNQLPKWALGTQQLSDNRFKVAASLEKAVYDTRQKNVLEGHNSDVIALGISRDGELVVSGDSDGIIKIWNGSGSLLTTLQAHTNTVRSIDFHPTRDLMISASKDGTIKLWDIEGEHQATLLGHSNEINRALFSPDGNLIVSASYDGTIKFWNLEGGLQKTIQADQGVIFDIDFKSDGSLFASAGGDGSIKFWNAQGNLVRAFDAQSCNSETCIVFGVSFSNNGEYLASASDNSKIHLWGLDGSFIQTIGTHSDQVHELDFIRKLADQNDESGDVDVLATVSRDNSAKLWFRKEESQFESLDHLALEGHDLAVNQVVFSPSSDALITASRDTTIQLWHGRRSTINKIDKHWHDNTYARASVHSNSEMLIAAGDSGHIKLWTFSVPKEELDTSEINKFQEIQSNGSDDTESQIFDKPTKSWNIEATELAEQGKIWDISFSPDGEEIATAGSDGTVKLWNKYIKHQHTLERHEGPVYDVSFSKDGRLATSGRDGSVYIWDTARKSVQQLKVSEESIYLSIFSPDGKVLATAGEDKVIRLWQQKQQQWQLQDSLVDHKTGVYSLAFSPDGKRLVSGGTDGAVKIWTANGDLINTVYDHYAEVLDIDFSPDGSLFATAGGDQKIVVWNRDGIKLHEIIGDDAAINSVDFSPDGKHIISASRNGYIAIRDFGLDSLIDKGCALLEDYFNTSTSIQPSRACSTPRISADSIFQKGQDFARSGDTEAAIAKFTEARKNGFDWEFDASEELAETIFQISESLESALDSLATEVDNAETENQLFNSFTHQLNRYIFPVKKFSTNQQSLQDDFLNPHNSVEVTFGQTFQEEQNENFFERIDRSAQFYAQAIQLMDKSQTLRDSNLSPEEEAKRLMALSLMREGGELGEVLKAYSIAQELYPEMEISASIWHALCRQGSENLGYAQPVIDACDRAIALMPENDARFDRYQDSYGIAKLFLQGNSTAATEAFQRFISWTTTETALSTYKEESLTEWREKRQQCISYMAGIEDFLSINAEDVPDICRAFEFQAGYKRTD